MAKALQFYIHLIRTSIKASISKRGAFLIESGLMIGNNLIFISMWWIFFKHFKEVGGWDLQDLIALIVIGHGAYGLMQVFFGGVKNLSKIIVSGDLDTFMTQPKNLLLHIAGSKSNAKGWGHLMSAVVLIVIGEIASVRTISLILVSMLSGCLVFTSFTIIAHSFSFWISSIGGLSKRYCDALFLFALYPSNIYSGMLQVVMFTLIPAGIITFLPVELLRNFSWPQLFILLGSSLAFFGMAVLIFYSGLKRYESGNQIGTRL